LMPRPGCFTTSSPSCPSWFGKAGPLASGCVWSRPAMSHRSRAGLGLQPGASAREGHEWRLAGLADRPARLLVA
jgi:hypothetical protein